MNQRPRVRQSEIVVQNLDNETLIYDLKTNKAFCLNETAGLVWNLCDGERTVTEIADSLSRETGQKVTEGLIGLALGELSRNGLLEGEQTKEETFSVLTRREAIRRIGFGSAIALPLVTAVVAPAALSAQSGGTVMILGACTTTADCQSGLTCRPCGNGTCPSPACCINTSPVGPGESMSVGSGGNLNFGFSESECIDDAAERCCSGTAVFDASGPISSCICN